ncbi:hypothetical protein EDF74_0622 [Stenotrophomonas rhizophila]|nr:hypothetical protein EDF74_0622 [Stenotrophomonas rhizophila]
MPDDPKAPVRGDLSESLSPWNAHDVMKTRTAVLSLALLAAAAGPAHAMKGCNFVDGSHESISVALLALDARQRGDSRESVLARAEPIKTDPSWHAAMARETVDEVFSDLPPVDAAVYTVYRAMICYRASTRPAEDVVVDYVAIHPALAACEAQPGPRQRGQCAGKALDDYFAAHAE